jgi:hypothetical protein
MDMLRRKEIERNKTYDQQTALHGYYTEMHCHCFWYLVIALPREAPRETETVSVNNLTRQRTPS